MNIKGVLELQKRGLPIMRNFFLFRKTDEISTRVLNAYGEDKRWAMRGFDDRTSISDLPYKIKDFREHGFSKSEIRRIYDKLNGLMEKAGVPEGYRGFFICEVFFDKDVEMSGHALKDKEHIYIDILNGNRPSGKDWTPHYSFKIDAREGKIDGKDRGNKYISYVQRIIKDILNFPINAYVDFTLLKDGYLFYHDFSVH